VRGAGRWAAKERWSLPPVAVREAVIHAGAHTHYTQRGAPIRVAIFGNRLEVESPGLLPFGLTVEVRVKDAQSGDRRCPPPSVAPATGRFAK
jgi:predicted HTH transcriptional regulator